MQKCVDIRNMETCDLFRTYNLVKNGCDDDGETLNEKQTYAFLFYYTQPKWELFYRNFSGSYRKISAYSKDMIGAQNIIK